MADIIDYEGLLKEWRKRLGLSEWRIALAPCCKAESMKLNGAAGCTEWEESTKVALIQILDPKEYGERMEPFDFEKTLVHELLHLKTCLVSDQVEPLQERYMHQMISDLSRALVDAKRFIEKANDIAIAPAEPVVHERWGEDGECSKCGFKPWYEHDIHTLSYCPNCGAKMDADKYLALTNQSGEKYADNPTV